MVIVLRVHGLGTHTYRYFPEIQITGDFGRTLGIGHTNVPHSTVLFDQDEERYRERDAENEKERDQCVVDRLPLPSFS